VAGRRNGKKFGNTLNNGQQNSLKNAHLGFFMMATITVAKPANTTMGASVILRKLKISGLKFLGSGDPPPDISIKPMTIRKTPAIISW
jgi:hypothetical protein